MTYVRVFFRQLARKKLFALINIIGLAVGLAGVLLLVLYVQDEWSFDRQHPRAEDKYRIETILSAGDEVLEIDASLPPVAPLLKENLAEIVDTTRFSVERVHVSATEEGSEGFYEEGLAFADGNIGEFFQFEWLQGEPRSALSTPDAIVLTEGFADKYFGDQDPMGRTLVLDGRLPLEVTGIIAATAQSTHIDADAIASMSALQELRGQGYLESWFGLGVATYVQLRPDVDMEALWPSIRSFLDNVMPPGPRQIFEPVYSPLLEVHLATRTHPATQRTRMDDTLVLFGISVAILLVACINFINLATARSSERQKEIAIRKVVGSGQRQVFVQHMGESIAMVALALVLALGLVELTLPLVNGFTGKQLSVFGDGFWLLSLLLGLVVAVLAGFYPALYLSGFRPLRVLRQSQRETAGFFSFRNLLVMFQFSIAIVAIVACIVMLLQLRLAKTRELGFDMENVLVLENSPGTQWESFRQAVRNRTSVEQVSAGLSRPFRGIATSALVRYEGADAPENLSQFRVDFDYFELFDVELLAGRYLSEEYATDKQQGMDEANPHPRMGVILNRAMTERLGWTPESALGRRFEVSAGQVQDFAQSWMGEVVGVVADMYVDPVQRHVVPQFYFIPADASQFDFQFFKLTAENSNEQIRQIETIWQEFYPDIPVNAYLLESKFEQLYQREEKQASLLGAFALLAVFISCMGLVGLATYATRQRIKEVGVRKTVGASVLQIIVLFSADFSKLVLIANVIAWPVAYVAMQRWLENFAYRIDLTPLIFIGSGLIALCVAWVTVGGTAAKAANQKPVLALRYE